MIFISQRKYVLDLLKETSKPGCRTLRVPIEQNHKIGRKERSSIEKIQYQILVQKLIYLSHMRPDITYALRVVSHFMHVPRERYMQTIDKILQYMRSSPRKELLFMKENTLTLKIYIDTNYASFVTDRNLPLG